MSGIHMRTHRTERICTSPPGTQIIKSICASTFSYPRFGHFSIGEGNASLFQKEVPEFFPCMVADWVWKDDPPEKINSPRLLIRSPVRHSNLIV